MPIFIGQTNASFAASLWCGRLTVINCFALSIEKTIRSRANGLPTATIGRQYSWNDDGPVFGRKGFKVTILFLRMR